MTPERLFDEWPEKYDQWFSTPSGKLVREYERAVILDLLKPRHGERILDAGCGTGIFTLDFLSAGARVVGLEISVPMLMRAGQKAKGYPFFMVPGDMMNLPFGDGVFDKTVSVTAIEFIQDAQGAIKELFRVTKRGGCVVVATLNSLSPWAARRKAKTQTGQGHVLEKAVFRSPDELRACAPVEGVIQTAVHFQKEDDPVPARKIESQGRKKGLDTGAFLVGCWGKA